MTTLDAYSDLLKMGRPIVTTNEAVARLGTSPSQTNYVLRTLEEKGMARHLRRGLWALRPDVDRFVVVPYLTDPYPAYISFWSALARHDMIQQIPREVSAASLDRTRKIKTSIAAYSIHHLASELFDGYEGSEETGYMAVPEKAFFDTVYIRAARGAMVYLPELSLPRSFNQALVEQWTRSVKTRRLRTMVSRQIDTAMAKASDSD